MRSLCVFVMSLYFIAFSSWSAHIFDEALGSSTLLEKLATYQRLCEKFLDPTTSAAQTTATSLDSLYTTIISIFVAPVDRPHSLAWLRDCHNTNERNQFIETIAQQWIHKTKEEIMSKDSLTIAPLNQAIKPLKSLHEKKQINAKKLLVAIYDTMIDIVYEHQELDTQKKIDQAKNIIKAIKNSATKNIFFISIGQDETGEALFEKANNCLIRLNSMEN